MCPLLELHDVLELELDEVLPAFAGTTANAISEIEARARVFMPACKTCLHFEWKREAAICRSEKFSATFSSQC